MKLPLPSGVEFATDPSVAEWIVERLQPWGPESSVERLMQVGSFLPEGFEAYARILAPGYRCESNIGTVRWSTLAELNGRVLGPETGFREITGLYLEDTQTWDEASPTDGCLPRGANARPWLTYWRRSL